MDTRRTFIRKASALAGGAGFINTLPASIQRAFAIDPARGTTYLDAEHVVILMQENRSFDHCYGALQGVRGFNDPRAITLPDNDLVWLQKNAAGEAFAPFRLNMKETKATWIGSLPHTWPDQVDARNGGKFDQWLIAKPSENTSFAQAPLTLGYYNREDLPFYYALADAFTVCDQNFSSSLTGTTPNRLYMWTGTIRAAMEASAKANVMNSDVNFDHEVDWTTFPERLEDNNITWKIYQNEIGLQTGLSDEEDSWLSNFSDNVIEWFTQYNVRFSRSYRLYLQKLIATLPQEIEAAKQQLASSDLTEEALAKAKQALAKKEKQLARAIDHKEKYSEENFAKLSQREKNLHKRAFTTNIKNPDFRQLETHVYNEDGVDRELNVPKGDVLHQFRRDVQKAELPSVSWIVAPEHFSDHPSSPWYGAWYVSEVMDILTSNPEIWKKTIFILCYDENDGYFDHVPPFVAPDTRKAGTGVVSEGINTDVEQVTLEQDLQLRPKEKARESAIGLGFRVPLVIASPWSRGGAVNSQVFDHTSLIQLLENIFQPRTKKKLAETNISAWRRAVCGDLSTVFQPYRGEKIQLPAFVEQEQFIQAIHETKFKKDPFGYQALSKEERQLVNAKGGRSGLLPQQEKGIRTACALPYELYAEAKLTPGRNSVEVSLKAGTEIFGNISAGSPFVIYGTDKAHSGITNENNQVAYSVNRNYAVEAGKMIKDEWSLDQFADNIYHLAAYGPNGFFREFAGDVNDPGLKIKLDYQRQRLNKKKLSGNIQFVIINESAKPIEVIIKDNAYNAPDIRITIGAAGSPGGFQVVPLLLTKTYGWYDCTLMVAGNEVFRKRYAGHVETGARSKTDPFMGDMVAREAVLPAENALPG